MKKDYNFKENKMNAVVVIDEFNVDRYTSLKYLNFKIYCNNKCIEYNFHKKRINFKIDMYSFKVSTGSGYIVEFLLD
jgi:hypothetical protein